MTDEMKALMVIKSAFRMSWDDDSLKRAPEYDAFGYTGHYFFRNGKGTVYETEPDESWIRSYKEEDLDEALMLRKYDGKVMTNPEIQKFLDSQSFSSIMAEDCEKELKVRTICATLSALGYDVDWIQEMFRDRLERTLSQKMNSPCNLEKHG